MHNLLNQLSDMNEKDPKVFWKTLDKVKNLDVKENNPINMKNWQEYFKSLLNSDDRKNDMTVNQNSEFTPNTHNDCGLNKPCSCKEIKIALKSLKNSKAEGIDLIRNEFLKYGSDIVVLPLVKLFNKVLYSGKFPTVWNISLISVIHKSGSAYDCENYRGISVCSCLGKLFTKLIQMRISNFLSENEILEDNQAGFRANYRTTDQIYIVKTLLNKYLHK